ncbi:MAG TPA: thymidine phosphorylase [Geminicoccaceae bacterium]|nr:thymidine phosphorylase [Geminicoccaceae bacterium]
MLPQEIIRKKRDGGVLDAEEIAFFVEGMSAGRISEGQAAAFAMAVYFHGMTRAETAALTLAKAASGHRLEWGDLGPVVDKHSTGGIGDKVSLILAPILAACGAYVPMISGRGLGHTGGTLDKLDSVPGYDTAPDLERLRRAVRTAGCAIIGQTAELAPADRRLYAIRDVTATVESVPLIVASILSKKLAAGLDALVMDVKVGSGAFLPSLDAARELARNLVEVANEAGLPCRALLTDMSQCLGHSAGNALEVREAIDLLTGARKDARLQEVTLALSAELLLMAGIASDADDARTRALRALDSGAAAERFARMVAALGGPSDLIERASRHLPACTVQRPVHLPRSGTIASINARALGLAIIALGGGRTNPADTVDHAVGLSEIAGVGEPVGADRPFAVVHARSEAEAEAAARRIEAAVNVVDEPFGPFSGVIIGAVAPG